MATGIPLANRRAKQVRSKENGTLSHQTSTDITLAYEGKQSESVILQTPPARLERGTTGGLVDSSPNHLYFGENLSVLAALLNDPAVRGQVRLIYIDPPYATKSVFQSRQQADAYSDLLEGAHYIEFLRARLILLRELLADNGSIYVHLDDKMAFLAKAIMDEVFGSSNFRNWITRKKCNPKNYTRKTFGNVADYILFYTKTDEYVWHRPVEAWTPQRADKEYQYTDNKSGRRYKKVPIHAPGVRNGETGQPWRGMMPPPGKHWQYRPSTLDEMDARGEIYWSPTGNPRRKVFLDGSDGVPVQDIWLDFRDAHNQNIHITGYPTEKNPELLKQIIAASSNEGDLVLDCFAGSGTTLEAAHRLDRQWIGIDNSPEAIRVILQRFANGLEPMGDFVQKPTPNLDELGLFSGEPEEISAQKRNIRHSPVLDFEMWNAVQIS
jgi:adenine-specific DNA-methyltransferase